MTQDRPSVVKGKVGLTLITTLLGLTGPLIEVTHEVLAVRCGDGTMLSVVHAQADIGKEGRGLDGEEFDGPYSIITSWTSLASGYLSH